MKKFKLILLAAIFCFCLTSVVMAAASDTITVNYEVQAINELNIDGASVTLTVNAATAGVEPDQATDSTTYDVTTNQAGRLIKGKIDTAMAANLTLKANLTAPTGGSSSGATTLTATDATVATCTAAVADADVNLTFTLDATVAAGVVSSASKTATFTLVAP